MLKLRIKRMPVYIKERKKYRALADSREKIKEKNELFEQFYHTVPDSRLLLVGSGVLEQEIKGLVLEKKLEQNVIFAGQQTNIADYLSAMDVFVLSSLFEGLPMVALEAQANGLPCVLADTITTETAVTANVWFYSLNNRNEWLNRLQIVNNTKNRQRILSEQDNQKMNMAALVEKLEQYYESGR